MTTPDKPSRFHASPAEIDAFLRENFAEDVLLNFYRAVGDEVLDEALTYGKQRRAVYESRHCKHLYLAGMSDVMDQMWDYRFYPAELPKLETYNRHFNARAMHPEDSTYHPNHTRLPSPKVPCHVVIVEVPGGWDARMHNDNTKTVVAATTYDGLLSKMAASDVKFVIMNPTEEQFDEALEASSLGAPHVKAERGPIPESVRERLENAVRAQAQRDAEKEQPCYRAKAHAPHQWLKGRKAVPCPGIPKEK